ncbi:hypothetical protein CCH79_00013274 [Gambusia affinis]|uniref:Derlin n=1 Tax=Gambusia affinis TaxID=33528 RepID=A0A315V503_GAMAF|nr:hypothetical protein CCH79_00013274 [Gambusia affinis]
MALSLTQEYFQIPLVTRTYTTACILTTAAVQLQVISPFQLYFNPELIISKYQIWRLITSFFFFGSLGFGFLFNIIFLYRYCRMLEEDCFRGRTADFVFMFLFGGILITDVFPNQPGGRKLLTTPDLLRVVFDPPERPDRRFLQEEQQEGGDLQHEEQGS